MDFGRRLAAAGHAIAIAFRPGRRDAVAASCAALGAALVLARQVSWGAALHWDSVLYIGVARSLAAGEGFTQYTGAPLPTLWPPLYPLLLALPGAAGIDPRDAAGPLNAALFALTICAAGRWLARRCESGFVAGWATLALAAAPALVWHASWAMSETLFVLLATLALIRLDACLRGEGGASTLVAAASLAALACLARYAGIALVAAALPLLALRPGAGRAARARDAVLYAAIALAPVALWALPEGAARGGGHAGGGDALLASAGRWLADEWGRGAAGGAAQAAAGALLLAVAGWLALRFASWAFGAGRERDAGPLAFGGFAFATLALYVAAASIDFAATFQRYLLPALLPLLLTVALALDRLLASALRRGLPWARAAAVALLLWLSWIPPWHASALREANGEGHGWANARWSNSEVLAHLREQPCDCLTVTSSPTAYYLHDGPGEYRGLPGRLAAVRELIARAPPGARVAWHYGGLFGAEYGADELRAIPELAVVADLEDGVVFRVRRAAPAP